MTGTAFPTPTEFLLSLPLYTEKPFSGEQTWKVIDLLYFDGTYDNFCTQCRRDATFQVIAPERPGEFKPEVYKLLQAQGMARSPQINAEVYRVRSECTRQRAHVQYFYFLVRHRLVEGGSEIVQIQSTIQKVGQHPSYGDLNLPKIRNYAAVLDKPRLAELGRAIALASHDVGVGAYVYLRRVFEALIEEAHETAKRGSEWDEDSYLRSRMSDRIKSLKEHLPSFLVDHPEVYSLLSKGVHELSEEDCLTHFTTLRLGIELILDQKMEQKQRESKLREAREALSQAASRHR